MEQDPETNGTDAKRFFPVRQGTVNFEVWGMPSDKYKEFLAFSKEVACGKMAVAIMTLMELSKSYEMYLELKDRIDKLEAKVEEGKKENVMEKPRVKTLESMRELAQKRVIEDGKIREISGEAKGL